MSDTEDTCPSTHTLRCTLARGHDGPHTAFRTRVSWAGDVDATARLREQDPLPWLFRIVRIESDKDAATRLVLFGIVIRRWRPDNFCGWGHPFAPLLVRCWDGIPFEDAERLSERRYKRRKARARRRHRTTQHQAKQKARQS